MLAAMLGAMVGLAVEAPPASSGPYRVDLTRLDMRAFRSPEAFFCPGYMWIWNDRLTKEEIRRQLRDMAEHGARTVMPMPEPKEFRPTSMPTRLEPDYLSPGYLAMYRFTAEEARRLGMVVWLYDEGGWPSGSVCGRLSREHPELGRQALAMKETHPAQRDTVRVPADALAAFLYRGSLRVRRLAPGEAMTVGFPDARLLMFHVQRGGYADLLNPEATRIFLRMTHEQYRSVVGERFGTTIPLTFTDEPTAADPPWTNGLPESFRARFGYDILDRLDSLAGGIAEQDERVRVDFYDWWSRRFADAYLGEIQRWCHDQGLFSGGHLNGEDETLSPNHYGFGHHLRAMRMMDVPGIDTIWRQIWPGREGHYFPRYAATVARQRGSRFALSESCAVYGSGLTPAQMKWIVDFEYVRGINLLDMVGYPYSTRDWMIGGERPHFGATSPLWPYMRIFNGYVSRLSYLLSVGQPDVRVAVYYPVRDIWARWKTADAAAESLDRLAAGLQDAHCDFDFVDDDALDGAGSTLDGGALVVGKMRYRTVCVPAGRWMTPGARAKLERFASAGGQLLWLGTSVSAPAGATCAGVSQVRDLVEPIVRMVPTAPRVRVLCRRTDDAAIYFLTNEEPQAVTVAAGLPEGRVPIRLNPETGCAERVQDASVSNGRCTVPIELPVSGSCVLLFTTRRVRTVAAPVVPGDAVLGLDSGWTARSIRSYVLGAKDIEVTDTPATPARAVALGDWRSAFGEGFSGDVEYSVRFHVMGDQLRRISVLDLGDVRHACHVTLNGRDLGMRLWSPWTFPVAGALRAGENVLHVVVTNTQGNQYVTTKALDRWTAVQLGPYHPRTRGFERDTMDSGLYGPVVLRSAR